MESELEKEVLKMMKSFARHHSHLTTRYHKARLDFCVTTYLDSFVPAVIEREEYFEIYEKLRGEVGEYEES